LTRFLESSSCRRPLVVVRPQLAPVQPHVVVEPVVGARVAARQAAVAAGQVEVELAALRRVTWASPRPVTCPPTRALQGVVAAVDVAAAVVAVAVEVVVAAVVDHLDHMCFLARTPCRS
jgi:hypothetical protein